MKPILFNTEMVKAILESRKTQFRIPIKLKDNSLVCTGYIFSSTDRKRNSCYSFGKNKECDMEYIKSKYKVDDILYVRETFKTFSNITMDNEVGVIYKADNKEVILPCNRDYECEYVFNDKWKPSIHMPKRYARVFLKVTNVRIERVQDISLTNMLEEGINHLKNYSVGGVVKPYTQIKREFINLWNSTIKDGYKWEDNPYVFVYEFEKIEKKDLERFRYEL